MGFLVNCSIKKISQELSNKLEVGEVTLRDIISEIKKPGRDPREEGIKPILRTDVLKIEDITEGMILKGTIRNVVDFGAFVDIGVKESGLIHVSQLCDKYISSPSEVVSIHQHVKVKVLDVDLSRRRISLTMKGV